jgi:hypothetical protein
MALLALAALPWIRQEFHELAIKGHFALGILVAAMLWLHLPAQMGFNSICLIVGAGLFTANSGLHAGLSIFRNLAAGQPLALADVVKHDGAVELNIRLPRPWKVRAGQYVHVRAPGVRFWSFAESHPFNIIWWEDGPDGKAVVISLLAKTESGFSRALSETRHKQLRVLIDGPYGECPDLNSYSSVVMIARNIGIAAHLPYVKELLHRQVEEQKLNAGPQLSQGPERISLIWELEEECE